MATGGVALGRRDLDDDGAESVMNLMVGLLGVTFFGLLLAAMLVMLRRTKRPQMMPNGTLAPYNNVQHGDAHNTNHLTIQTANGHSSIFVVNGRPMLADPNAPPHSPNNIPQIHITFPDEQDENGRRQRGRVVVVRVGDATVGLEPVKDEQLPAYQKDTSNGFYSIDIDNIGGLKEKNRSEFS